MNGCSRLLSSLHGLTHLLARSRTSCPTRSLEKIGIVPDLSCGLGQREDQRSFCQSAMTTFEHVANHVTCSLDLVTGASGGELISFTSSLRSNFHFTLMALRVNLDGLKGLSFCFRLVC